jgi:hypothetical protein
MNFESLNYFLFYLNKKETVLKTVHSAGPDPAREYSPQGVAAFHARSAVRLAGPRPGGPVRRRSGPRRGNRARSPVALWRLAGGKVLPVSSRGPQGGCRARWLGVELTRAVARCRGGGGCFGRRCSSVGRELRWPVAMEARPCSVGAEEGR